MQGYLMEIIKTNKIHLQKRNKTARKKNYHYIQQLTKQREKHMDYIFTEVNKLNKITSKQDTPGRTIKGKIYIGIKHGTQDRK